MTRRLFFGTLAAGVIGARLAPLAAQGIGCTGGARVGAIAGAFATGGIIRNPGVTYFGCYTALNDHESFISLEPGALARAIERLKPRA